MKSVIVELPDNGLSQGTIVRTPEGVELRNITRIELVAEVDQPTKARLTFLCPVLAPGARLFEATVSEEHLRELAEAHGYVLVRHTPIGFANWKRDQA